MWSVVPWIVRYNILSYNNYASLQYTVPLCCLSLQAVSATPQLKELHSQFMRAVWDQDSIPGSCTMFDEGSIGSGQKDGKEDKTSKKPLLQRRLFHNVLPSIVSVHIGNNRSNGVFFSYHTFTLGEDARTACKIPCYYSV